MLGIVVAMEREARVVHAALATRGLASRARVAVSGIGPRRAGEAAQALAAGGASALVVFGLAGALVDGIAAGDVLIPRRVCDAEGAVFEGGDPHALAATVRLHGLVTVHDALLVSVARAVLTREDKRALAAASGAVAVDMESAAVASVARAAGLRWTVLRTVSDAADRALPQCAVHGVDGHGRVRALALAAAIARRPWELGALFALGRDVRHAQRMLGSVAAAVLPVLCAGPAGSSHEQADHRTIEDLG